MSDAEQQVSAADFLPETRTLADLRSAAATCRGCDLYEHASQTVFGKGLTQARVMLVGEMPGNDEDRAGEPFVGPAGRVLNEALEDAGIERKDAYVTNVVKHFSWEPRGKRRLHKTPNQRQVRACLPWLQAEVEAVRPEACICLGATAAKALLGREFRISRQHGEIVSAWLAPYTTAVTHPSAVLRQRDKASRDHMRGQLVADLRGVAQALDGA